MEDKEVSVEGAPPPCLYLPQVGHIRAHRAPQELDGTGPRVQTVLVEQGKDIDCAWVE